MKTPQRLLFLTALLCLCLLSLVAALALGSFNIPLEQVLSVLGGKSPGLAGDVILELRLPRALSALVVGAELGLAGCLMQVLLRNPLADPYVLGVSGGASVGALLAMSAGLGSWAMSGSALLGALVNLLLVFGLARGRGSWSPTRLLLTGVVCASGWGAMISFLLATSEDSSLRGMLFWLMGDLSHAGMPGWELPLLGIALALAWILARPLNLMLRGEQQALALGVPIYPLQLLLYLLASVLTAAAVTRAGSIGFLGLVVPHILRLVAGSDHRLLLPASALAGGALLLLADTLARTLLAPQQLPVGVVTALLGVPLFLLVLHRSTRGGAL
ncbi:iron ABC transporter permease [Motiliproteus sp. SC1-56]|uniref:FecCD family ABC transporter permease n=1 Tax=Motiliproteus sp. SC1-56 TaxID=2799565 RepID=UPI001A8CA0B5|nr:iron ABC transporter permease [Motiliproteus sp. SC1-56]